MSVIPCRPEHHLAHRIRGWCSTCGGPLWREGKHAVFVLAVDGGWCRLCDLRESRADGEGVLRHRPATSWCGREDEANAWEELGGIDGRITSSMDLRGRAAIEERRRRWSRPASTLHERGLMGHTRREVEGAFGRITHVNHVRGLLERWQAMLSPRQSGKTLALRAEAERMRAQGIHVVLLEPDDAPRM